jgi:predicted chitinase
VPRDDKLNALTLQLNKATRRFGITTRLRLAAFLGNAMVETQWFALMEESGDSQKYSPWKGRGFLQLTWPDNYIKYWRFRGRQVSDGLAKTLHDAAVSSSYAGNNAELTRAEDRVPQEMTVWRNEIGDAKVNAADSAGAYWAWSGAMSFADQVPVLSRETEAVGTGHKPYYSCQSFGQVAATVNLGSPSNHLSGVNGLVERYQAYAGALLIFEDRIPFPDAGGTLHDVPDR